jgi:S-adenosylmethionine:tRNA ribosyltransferase-isomerase
MRLEELDFHIPERLIAQVPLEQRDSCRLLRLGADGRREHRVFSDLPEILRPGDTLVFNDSRVLPARVEAHRSTGGKVELLFLRPMGGGKGPAERWEALARPSHRLKPGEVIELGDGDAVALCEGLGEGSWLVEGRGGRSLLAIMERHGRLPLPPYIKTYPADPSSYQTVYAAAPGSAAAPTAGLHFTPALQERLQAAGIRAAYVTLHVGLDTFQPIREQTVEAHKIHREAFSVSSEALAAIRSARTEGRRVVAVGTTATRVLETLAGLGALDGPGTRPDCPDGWSADAADGAGVSASTEIYITPGYHFRAVDALITNFHLPRSTVLALTMAFVGVERLREAYAEAIAMDYRFFSFGDAMLAEGRDAHV